MERMELTRKLRASVEVHYNCCQSVLISFAPELGLTPERAYALGAHFGGGMRHGSTCGALTGALMVLGLLGFEEEQAKEQLEAFRARHGALDCDTLLELSRQRGEEKHPHCDGLVLEMVQILEELLRAREEGGAR